MYTIHTQAKIIFISSETSYFIFENFLLTDGEIPLLKWLGVAPSVGLCCRDMPHETLQISLFIIIYLLLIISLGLKMAPNHNVFIIFDVEVCLCLFPEFFHNT